MGAHGRSAGAGVHILFPAHGYVVVTVLPRSPSADSSLLTYVRGLCATLLAIALLGQRAVSKLRWAADPDGWLRRGLGFVFIAVGVLVRDWLDEGHRDVVDRQQPGATVNLDRGSRPNDTVETPRLGAVNRWRKSCAALPFATAAVAVGLLATGCSSTDEAQQTTENANAAVCLSLEGLAATVEGLSTGGDRDW